MSRFCRCIVSIAAVGATIVACADSPDAAESTSVVDISATEYAQAPRLPLEPSAVICGAGDDARCPFRRVDIAAARGDLVLLGDAGGLLRLYDATDGSVREFGRVGSGPGEYRGAMAVDFDADGAVTLFDVRLFRWVRYDGAGETIATERVEPFAEFMGADVAGRAVVLYVLPGGDQIGDSVRASFTAVKEPGDVPVQIATVAAIARTLRGSAMIPLGRFFQGRPVWDATDGPRIAYAGGTRFEIERFDGSGDSLLIRIAIEPRPVRQEDIDALLRERIRPDMQPQYRAATEAAARESASHFPAFDDLRLLRDGSIWVREAGPPGDSLRWDRFGPDGQLAGFILLPPAARVLAGDGDRILVLDHDPFDVPLVTWYVVESRTPA